MPLTNQATTIEDAPGIFEHCASRVVAFPGVVVSFAFDGSIPVSYLIPIICSFLFFVGGGKSLPILG